MEEHKIPLNPLYDTDLDLLVRAMVDEKALGTDERRYIAEHNAVKVTKDSSLEECAKTVSKLAVVHIPQLNAQFKDQAKSRHYSNPIELIREESKRRDNKKIWHTGNIDTAHQRIKSLNSEIVSEETPAQMRKTVFWSLLIGLALLALAVYSCCTGAGVGAVKWMLNSTWFKVVFILVTLGLSAYFGFFSIGVLIVGAVFVLAWVILELPGLASVIVNGLLFIIAAVFIIVAYTYTDSIKKYKALSEEELRINRERIDEKEALRRELNEYSDTMLDRLDIMKQKFSNNDRAFYNEMRKYLGDRFDIGAVYDLFSFLNKYYRKMKR